MIYVERFTRLLAVRRWGTSARSQAVMFLFVLWQVVLGTFFGASKHQPVHGARYMLFIASTSKTSFARQIYNSSIEITWCKWFLLFTTVYLLHGTHAGTPCPADVRVLTVLRRHFLLQEAAWCVAVIRSSAVCAVKGALHTTSVLVKGVPVSTMRDEKCRLTCCVGITCTVEALPQTEHPLGRMSPVPLVSLS